MSAPDDDLSKAARIVCEQLERLGEYSATRLLELDESRMLTGYAQFLRDYCKDRRKSEDEELDDASYEELIEKFKESIK